MNVPPSGPADASILLVGNAPTKFDVKEMRPWTGEAGTLLQTELRRAGINFNNVRITNMWQHAKTADCELAPHLDTVLQEMHKRPHIILMGADVVKLFTGENVSDVSGLRVDNIVDSYMMPMGARVYALFNPAIAMHDKLGEVRHGLSRIAGEINGNKAG